MLCSQGLCIKFLKKELKTPSSVLVKKMDSLTIIIIVILIIIILVGYYLHKDMKRKIDIITVETVKNKNTMTSIIDEFSDSKKDTEYRVKNLAQSVVGTLQSLDSLKKENFTISRNNNPMAMPQRVSQAQPAFKMSDMKPSKNSFFSNLQEKISEAKKTARPNDGMATSMEMTKDPTAVATNPGLGTTNAETAAAFVSLPVPVADPIQGHQQSQSFNVTDNRDIDYIDEAIHPIQADFDDLGINAHINSEQFF